MLLKHETLGFTDANGILLWFPSQKNITDIISQFQMLLKHETLGFTDANGILLWFPSQKRTFSVPKTYVFGSETVRFWDGERKRETD